MMVKYYCDRCGKEAEKLEPVQIPTEKTKHEVFIRKTIHVCPKCKKEYDDILNKLVDIRFVMFSTFMKGGAE